MKWEADYANNTERARFDSTVLAQLLVQYQPLEAWRLIGGDMPDDDMDDLSEEARDNRSHGPVKELGSDEGFDAEEIDFMQRMLAQFNTQGYALEEID